MLKTSAAAPSSLGDEPVGVMLDWAQRQLPVACSVALTLGDPAQPERAFTRDADAQAADGMQWLAQQGPTFDAAAALTTVCSDNLLIDDRWPGLRQMLVTNRPLASPAALSAIAAPAGPAGLPAVLTAYSPTSAGFSAPGQRAAFGSVVEAIAQLLAMRQRVVSAEKQVVEMQLALQTRAPIEQAKGVVATRLGTSVEEAFTVMVKVSQNRNVKLRHLAAVVASDPGSAEMDELLRRGADRSSTHR